MDTFLKLIMSYLQKNVSLSVGFFLVLFICWPTWVFSEDSHYQGLAPGKGRQQVLDNCTTCHSTAIILQNYMTRKKWDQTLTWMQKKQGLRSLELDLREKILDYLSTHQGAKSLPSNNPLGHQYTYSPNPL
jgi:hypothetical protein